MHFVKSDFEPELNYHAGNESQWVISLSLTKSSIQLTILLSQEYVLNTILGYKDTETVYVRAGLWPQGTCSPADKLPPIKNEPGVNGTG